MPLLAGRGRRPAPGRLAHGADGDDGPLPIDSGGPRRRLDRLPEHRARSPPRRWPCSGALTKFGMGIVHGDGNTRQCMATAVVAYKQAFGFDAPPYTYHDLEESDCIVLVGSNMCIAHPILWERVMRNRNAPEIIVVDPRRTETAMAASLHLPVRPKTDLVLLYGLANLLIQNGWIDRPFIEAHTSGFDEFADFRRADSTWSGWPPRPD